MKTLFCIFQFVLILCLCGCALIKERGKKQPETAPVVLEEFSGSHDTAALSAAKNFAAAFEKSIRLNDFQFLQMMLPRSSRSKFTTDAFAKLHAEMSAVYGNFQKMEYVTWLNQGKVRDYLWKMTFIKSGKPGEKGLTREILFCVRMFCEKDKQPDVAGFFFRKF